MPDQLRGRLPGLTVEFFGLMHVGFELGASLGINRHNARIANGMTALEGQMQRLAPRQDTRTLDLVLVLPYTTSHAMLHIRIITGLLLGVLILPPSWAWLYAETAGL